jgi:hypothetical protein
VQQLLQAPTAQALGRGLELGQRRLAEHRALDLAEDADARRVLRAAGELRKRERERGTPVQVVHDDVLPVHVGHVRDDEPPVVADGDAPGSLVEDDRLPVLQADLVVDALGLLAQEVEGTIVEDVAVLVDLDERRPAMLGRLTQYL